MLILSILGSANASSDRPGHDFWEEQTTSQPPCGNSKEFISKIRLSYMWYNYYTIFFLRTGERLQATKGQIIPNKNGDSHFICTLYIKHISAL